MQVGESGGRSPPGKQGRFGGAAGPPTVGAAASEIGGPRESPLRNQRHFAVLQEFLGEHFRMV